MSLLQARGGIPHVFRDTIDTTGRKHKLPFYTSAMVARNQGSFPVRMYFTEADFTANENFVVLPVPAATDPHGEWVGPVEIENLWFRGIGGSAAIEITVFQRRG